MTPYVGCDYAQEHLEAFIDGELSVEEQVAVESHVRWCRTCADRIDDMRLIGASIRVGAPVLARVAAAPVDPGVVHSRVLMRVRAERQESLASRAGELFSDMRLLWPALGATLAAVLCVLMAAGVLRSASIERPESLAMRLDALANPGSELNPLRPDNNARVDGYFSRYVDSDRAGGISMPRVLDEGAVFEGIGDQEGMFTMATVVSREGRIANASLLRSERGGVARASDIAILDAVRQSRFAPAQTPVGRAVAVNMVWLIVVTKVQEPSAPTAPAAAPEQVTRVAAPVRRLPAEEPGGTPLPPVVGRQSSRLSASPTA